ncbi:Cys/Met metabolism PLP-dependent enzyme-domain-containing protein [Mycena sanguinolenta]|nr:Cys/Met metabolism PLP-dependent enzyme-domain-containing protein [Mycena sanguinolenta]
MSHLGLVTKPGFETMQLHAGQRTDPHTRARAVPIYQTAGYLFDSVQHGANLASMKEKGYLYSRVGNPTVAAFEERITELEGGVAAVATSSGQSAITLGVLAIAQAGDNIVTASRLYGGVSCLLPATFQKYGITPRFITTYDVKDFEAAIDEKTKCIYVEIITNSDGVLTNVREMADVREIDATFAMGGYIIKPFDHGADIIIHSATKWIGGHGTTIGGVIIDSGKFDWRKYGNKYPALTGPCASQDDAIFAEKFYPMGYALFIKAELLRDMGNCLSAMSAFLILQGLETLSLRAQRHCENTLAIAKYLHAHPKVDVVNYVGLEDHPSHQLALQTLRPNAFGGVITFTLKGKVQNAIDFIEGLRLATQLANVGDAKTLVLLPFVTVQAQLTEDERVKSGVTPGLIRMSIGIESIEDLLGDIENALRIAFPEKA